jgi:hypothetical protein
MINVKPKIAIRTLTEADIGAFVKLDSGAVALVTVANEDPEKRVSLAEFDKAANVFSHKLYLGEAVLTFGGELVFEPDISSVTPAVIPTHNSGTSIFIDGESLYIVVRINPTHDFRLVDIRKGVIVKWQGRPMPVLRGWSVGVAAADGQFARIFKAP